MSHHSNHYQVIDAFFDCYSLSDAVSLLGRATKTADKEKKWKGQPPSHLLLFMEKFAELIAAAFSIVERDDHNIKVILNKDDKYLWSLAQYETYCGWHIRSAPWDFFPRHLSKKEFSDPYRVLKKFTRYRSLFAWKELLKDILFHALSPNSISEFDDGASLLIVWLHLHKLLEATHLMHVRTIDEKKQRRHFKGKDREQLLTEETVLAGEEKNNKTECSRQLAMHSFWQIRMHSF